MSHVEELFAIGLAGVARHTITLNVIRSDIEIRMQAYIESAPFEEQATLRQWADRLAFRGASLYQSEVVKRASHAEVDRSSVEARVAYLQSRLAPAPRISTSHDDSVVQPADPNHGSDIQAIDTSVGSADTDPATLVNDPETEEEEAQVAGRKRVSTIHQALTPVLSADTQKNAQREAELVKDDRNKRSRVHTNEEKGLYASVIDLTAQYIDFGSIDEDDLDLNADTSDPTSAFVRQIKKKHRELQKIRAVKKKGGSQFHTNPRSGKPFETLCVAILHRGRLQDHEDWLVKVTDALEAARQLKHRLQRQ